METIIEKRKVVANAHGDKGIGGSNMIGKFFTDNAGLLESLLERIEERFEFENEENLHEVYYWILNIERYTNIIGKNFYSRVGHTTLPGLLRIVRLWLRPKIYTGSLAYKTKLIDNNGKLIPQHINGELINLEQLVSDIRKETEILKKLFDNYSDKEKRLIEEFKQLAVKSIRKRR